MTHISVQPCGLRAGARPFSASTPANSMCTRVDRRLCTAKCSLGPWGTSAEEDGNVVRNRRQALLAAASAAILPSVASNMLQLSAASPATAAAAATATDAQADSYRQHRGPVLPYESCKGFKAFQDATLAYKFLYPTQTASGQPLHLVVTRRPEKYSSAAPLSADARQRICSELFDLKRFVTVSMTVGPASGVLRDKPQEQWTPREVALTVLIDRSTGRLSSGQRTALNDVEESHKEEREGQVYYLYEHTSQGSPTINSLKPETYRHALAVTTTRPGLDGEPYLYTLNVSCPQALWDDLIGPFKTSVDSFQLVPTTRNFIAPDQHPWLFF